MQAVDIGQGLEAGQAEAMQAIAIDRAHGAGVATALI
jgi:hypothetical protein